jgi:hypothetical protein
VRRTSDFVAWLLRQQDRDDPVGDLAQDIQRDIQRNKFSRLSDVAGVRSWVRFRLYPLTQNSDVFRSFDEAFAEYRTGECRTWDKLRALMDEHPTLSHFGIGQSSDEWFLSVSPEWKESWNDSPEQKDRIFQAERRMLGDCTADVTWTIGWLRLNVEPIKTINRRHSSYGLKHLAEKFSPNLYLSNGVFIAAALIVGYPFKVDPPNAMFGMSERSIRRLHRAAARIP